MNEKYTDNDPFILLPLIQRRGFNTVGDYENIVSTTVRVSIVESAIMAKTRSYGFKINGNGYSVEVFLALLSCQTSCGESYRIEQEVPY
jgi:hypothetical protein